MADFKNPGQHIYNGMFMSGSSPPEVLDRVPDFQFRSDDVLIATYPKAGTSWLQQITWLIMNDIDIDTSRKVVLRKRSPLLEIFDNFDELPNLKSPRIMKTHLPYQFFKNSIEGEYKTRLKLVVGMRNVKDVLVSYYHFYRMNSRLGNFNQNFDAFFNLFKNKTLINGDYFDHVLSWWRERDNPNLHFVKYEDMKENPREEILKLASFLGKTLSDMDVEVIINESSFASMQENPMTNMSHNALFDINTSKFIRKGQVGDWKNYLTEEQVQYIDHHIETELAANGLEFQE